MTRSTAHWSRNAVKLRTCTDWPRWIARFETIATRLRIWDQVNPDSTDPKPMLEEPSSPAQLTPDEQVDEKAVRRYNYQRGAYRDAVASYDKQQKAICDLSEWIQDNAGDFWVFAQGKPNVRDQVIAIKAAVAPSDWEVRTEIRHKWNKAIQPPIRSQDIESWIREFNSALIEAKRIDLSETADVKPVEAFLWAIKPMNEPFFHKWYGDLRVQSKKSADLDELAREFPTAPELSNFLLSDYRIAR